MLLRTVARLLWCQVSLSPSSPYRPPLAPDKPTGWCVSGTHRLPFNPEGTLVRGTFRSASGKGNLPADALDQRLMPNFVEAALPAGSAIAFDSKLPIPLHPVPPESRLWTHPHLLPTAHGMLV